VIRRARLGSSPRGHIKVVTIEARATGVQQACNRRATGVQQACNRRETVAGISLMNKRDIYKK
jgi:hypothetical protein